MNDRWYREAVVYCLDVETFQDSDGDGVGDLPGLMSRLGYLARLGVTCLWLNPVHPSPRRDDGYDVTDYYGVGAQFGTLGDFADLVRRARDHGIRVIMDLVVNHTSAQHPWFTSACESRDSAYRDWYIWSETEPPDRRQGMVFPGEQSETWTYHDRAGAWYFHRFYDFEPDLDWANPEVRREIANVMAFWLQLGVSGFRVDAAPFVIELTRAGEPANQDFGILDGWRQETSWHRGDTLLLAEANVGPDALVGYFSGGRDVGDRFHMLFDFALNARLMLALARGDARPVVEALGAAPALPPTSQWATFLRNHDEVDLSRLSDAERAEVFAALGPDPSMQVYGRGIRRRLAPMLDGDQRRLRLAYSLQFTLPGTPVLRYGEEIGMGDDLSLPGRDSVRTPMQWAPGEGGGFTTAPAGERPLAVVRGPYAADHVNVTTQRRDPDSLLSWFERMIRSLRECPEVGTGTCTVLDLPVPSAVLVHRADGPDGAMLFLHNLGTDDVTVDVGRLDGADEAPLEVFADQGYDAPGPEMRGLVVAGRGYRWIRLRREQGAG